MSGTLCEKCDRSFGPLERQCIWTRKNLPVQGWEAKPTIQSYEVLRCPKYLPDRGERKKMERRQKRHCVECRWLEKRKNDLVWVCIFDVFDKRIHAPCKQAACERFEDKTEDIWAKAK